jgi:uncharacterized protein (TIGR02145 family)
MKIKILNLFLIGSIVSSVMLSSCSKDDEPTPDNPDYSQDKGEFKDIRDSKIYKWVKIGEKVWMAENLNYTGNDIQHITDDGEWVNESDYDGWCYYDNNKNYGNTYGVLYQLNAAKRACPAGWHLPTDEEWDTFISNIAEIFDCAENEVGGLLKAAGTKRWKSPNEDASNRLGFSVLPSGVRNGDADFGLLGDYCGLWSATELDHWYLAYNRSLDFNFTDVVSRDDYSQVIGFSVRCVKD